jgi:zinc transport system substrate-binding protein
MFRFAAILSVTALPAFAAPPQVVADIAPVHALVAQVMEGVAVPELLLNQGSSPHHVTLRPSQAKMLSGADLMIWVGAELSPWLGEALEALSEAQQIELVDNPATHLRQFGDAEMAAEDDEHGDDHEDHGEDEHHHDHDGVDPHVWLSPDNAAAWLPVIADELAALDPENAATYRANAATAVEGIAALKADINAKLAAYQGAEIVTFHDAFGYFTRDFGLVIAGSVRPGDATAPSAAAVDALQAIVSEHNIGCAFTEPGFDPALLNAIASDAGIRIGVLDPIGAEQEPGPNNYAATLTAIADNAAACLSAQ